MYFAHASVGWDTNPRFPVQCRLSIAKDNTPANFAAALRRAKDWTDRNAKPGAPRKPLSSASSRNGRPPYQYQS